MDRFLTLDEVAETLGLHRNTLYNWINKKQCPIAFIKIRGALRIRQSELESYLKKKTVKQVL